MVYLSEYSQGPTLLFSDFYILASMYKFTVTKQVHWKVSMSSGKKREIQAGDLKTDHFKLHISLGKVFFQHSLINLQYKLEK